MLLAYSNRLAHYSLFAGFRYGSFLRLAMNFDFTSPITAPHRVTATTSTDPVGRTMKPMTSLPATVTYRMNGLGLSNPRGLTAVDICRPVGRSVGVCCRDGERRRSASAAVYERSRRRAHSVWLLNVSAGYLMDSDGKERRRPERARYR